MPPCFGGRPRLAIDPSIHVKLLAPPIEFRKPEPDRAPHHSEMGNLAQQALFAFVDSLVKTILTCTAEPPMDARDQAVAQGKFRYDRFLKSVGAAMAGDSKAAMIELLNHSEKG